MLAHRVRAWLRDSPQPRLRQLLLAIYLLTAAADAGGKALASNPRINQALASRVTGAAAEEMREAARPSGNFEIFRAAARHLVQQKDLYAAYPAEHSDHFKYSPTFALLFAPFAWLAWPLALFLWSSLNALVLFFAVERALPGRAGLLALLCLHLDVLRVMQNAQSNTLVAGLIVFAWVAAERRRAWGTALAVALGACIKIFPLAALTFAVPRRLVFRTGLCAVGFGVLLVALPLVVTPPDTLLRQYESWRGVESMDVPERWFSVMALLQTLFGGAWPNWPVQLAGTLTLLAPLALRRDRWDDARFRFLYLCSVLMFVVLFNHQAERAAYMIGFTGATLWFAGSPRAPWRTAMWATAFVTVTLMSTLIPGAMFRGPTAMVLRLCIPTLAIWLAVQWELLASGRQRGLEVDLHVPLQR